MSGEQKCAAEAVPTQTLPCRRVSGILGGSAPLFHFQYCFWQPVEMMGNLLVVDLEPEKRGLDQGWVVVILTALAGA